MLCISAAHAVVHVCLSVCLCVCVCVSDTFLNSVKTSKHIINFIHHRVDPSLQLFHAKGIAIFRQEPPNGGVECRGVGRNRDF